MNIKAVFVLLSIAGSVSLNAQNASKDPQQKEKDFYDSIQKKVDQDERQLELEGWQTFYLDSIYMHDFKAMNDEFDALNGKKVQNYDIYLEVEDKWKEQMYQSIRGILNDEQWKKYLKSGASGEKKARDKRAQKRLEGK